MKLSTVNDVQRVELPRHLHEGGELVVVEQGKSIPFAVVRAFTVSAGADAIRGRHAHKRCAQFLMCVHGAIEVECDDGERKVKLALESGHVAVLVPPTIWATEIYLTAGAILTVLCDRHYEAEDYIRDYDQFLAWRRAPGTDE